MRAHCCCRVLELIEVLVDYGADVDAMDKRGEAPLHYATRCGNADTACFLLEKGAMVDTDPSCREQTPLHIAAACGHVELASMLLEEAGAEPLSINAKGYNPKQVAAAAGRQRKMAQVLSNGPFARQQGKLRHPKTQGAQQQRPHGQAAAARRTTTAPNTRPLDDRNAFEALWG